jgi:dethiobiotin synthetase
LRRRWPARRSTRGGCSRLLAPPRPAPAAPAALCAVARGLLVPLSPGYSVRDLAVDLALPLVVAASPGLGTINHTLLTIEASRAAGLEVFSVVLTPWPGQPTRVEQSNRETIAALGEVEVETLPRLDLDNPSAWPTLGVGAV